MTGPYRGRHRAGSRDVLTADALVRPQPVSGVLGAGSLAARAYLTVVAGLLFWSLLPILFGLHPVLVRTGSMAPAIEPGDVILVQHVAGDTVRPGQVVLASEPGSPGRLLSHRVVGLTSNGDIITRGDANQVADSTPLRPADIKGVARLRIPYVGRPVVWWWQGRRSNVGIWLAISLLAVFLVSAGTSRARHARRHTPRASSAGYARLPVRTRLAAQPGAG